LIFFGFFFANELKEEVAYTMFAVKRNPDMIMHKIFEEKYISKTLVIFK